MASSPLPRILCCILVLLLNCSETEQKKNKGKDQLPNIEKLRRPAVGPAFASDLANVSRAATKLLDFNEYEQVSATMIKILVREAEKGTRVLHFSLVNPERQFGQNGDLSRYGDVLEFMLKSKGMPETDEGILSATLGCLPLRERFCVDKISRASRLGSWITVENCHRWSTSTQLLSDVAGAPSDIPDLSVDWQKLCVDCFSQRVQCSVRAFREHGPECLTLSDEESDYLTPQFPSNWTIDVSTRTTIGGMRMEERKMVPIGGRWSPLVSLHALLLQELVEGGLHVKPLKPDGTPAGDALTIHSIRDAYPGTYFNFAIHLW